MKEQELNALMSVVTDPIENVYKLDSYKDVAEIQRIIRIWIKKKPFQLRTATRLGEEVWKT